MYFEVKFLVEQLSIWSQDIHVYIVVYATRNWVAINMSFNRFQNHQLSQFAVLH